MLNQIKIDLDLNRDLAARAKKDGATTVSQRLALATRSSWTETGCFGDVFPLSPYPASSKAS